MSGAASRTCSSSTTRAVGSKPPGSVLAAEAVGGTRPAGAPAGPAVRSARVAHGRRRRPVPARLGRGGCRAHRGTRHLGPRRRPRSTCGPTRRARPRRASTPRGPRTRPRWPPGSGLGCSSDAPSAPSTAAASISPSTRRSGPWAPRCSIVPRRERPLGEGARLVEADHVHPGEALDGRQLLGQDLLRRQPGGAHGEGDAGQQDESLGHHRHQARPPTPAPPRPRPGGCSAGR